MTTTREIAYSCSELILQKLNMSLKCFILFLSAFLIADCCAEEDVKLWAVLVAGSNTYYNYRHQADICHAYQILHKHGIPDERIIVMMYDDIAHNEENPTKGIIINRPNGTDVYKGVPKDYVGHNVTPQIFLDVLLGKSEKVKGKGSGKVLKSGPNDHVFINFADHGAPGLVAFPDGELYARDLIKTLETMNKKRQYKKLVIYVEACESGSMFEDILKNNLSIFATTASSSEESSYACYWDNLRQAYLGDLYSVNWMEDSDVENLNTETLQGQFLIVRNETNTSHAQEYGDLSIGKMAVAEFQGKNPTIGHKYKKIPYDAIPSHEVPLMTLKKKLKAESYESGDPDKALDYMRQIHKLESNRKFLLEKVKEIVRLSVSVETQVKYVWNQKLKLKNFDCHEIVVRYFSKYCFKLSKNDYAMRYVFVFVNMCEMGIKPKAMRKAMDKTCTFPPVYGIY